MLLYFFNYIHLLGQKSNPKPSPDQIGLGLGCWAGSPVNRSNCSVTEQITPINKRGHQRRQAGMI